MSNGWTVKGLRIMAEAMFRLSPLTTCNMVLLTKKNEKSLDTSQAIDQGGGLVGIPVATHGYASGAMVNISGTVNYNGAYTVGATSTANVIVIQATYVAETFTGAEKIHEQPGPSTLTMANVLEIAGGNGYTAGGLAVPLNATGVPILVESPPTRFYLRFQDCLWTASAGPIPASGLGARYAALRDDVAGPTSKILAYWDLLIERTVADGQQTGILAPQLDFNWQRTA